MVNCDDEFEKLLDNYDYNYKKGDLVKGVVCSFDGDSVSVDIGTKAMAYVPVKEVVQSANEKPQDVISKGSEYEFLIIKDEDEDSRFMLSYKRVAIAHNWKKLEELKSEDAVVLGTVTNVVRGGIIVDVGGVKGFVPSSHLRLKESEDLVGSEIELKILSMDAAQNNFILSNKKVFQDSTDEKKKATLSDIEVGTVVEGEIVRITDFGAFVDLGGLDGLLPLSQISWKWVEHPSDVLKLAQKVKVEVIGVDYSKQRVSLSLKNLEPDPWIEAAETLKEGDWISGTITRLKPFGAFIDIKGGIEALLPVDEVNDYQSNTGKTLNIGDNLDVKIIKFNPNDKRISLSLK